MRDFQFKRYLVKFTINEPYLKHYSTEKETLAFDKKQAALAIRCEYESRGLITIDEVILMNKK